MSALIEDLSRVYERAEENSRIIRFYSVILSVDDIDYDHVIE